MNNDIRQGDRVLFSKQSPTFYGYVDRQYDATVRQITADGTYALISYGWFGKGWVSVDGLHLIERPKEPKPPWRIHSAEIA